MKSHELRVYDSILEMLPDEHNPTPLVRLQKVNPLPGIELYAKLEWLSPFGAVKDRIAWNMLLEAEKKNIIGKKKLIEPTSGNTGIGLAAIANLKGYKVRNIVSQEIPQEKKDILRFLGVELIEVMDTLCPDPNEPGGAIGVAKSTVKNMPNDFLMLNQYENEDNWKAHYKTTAPEIWRQTNGKVTHFAASLGTCGTITGCAKFLKEKNKKIKIIGIHPEEGHAIPGVRSKKQLNDTKLFMPELYDELVEVSNNEAYEMCLRLNREEGLLAGPSSGLAVAGALKALSQNDSGNCAIIFPDNVFKYTNFLEKHFAEMLKTKPKTQEPLQQAATLIPPPPEFQRNPELQLEALSAKQWIEQEKPIIQDVRPREAFSEGHVPNSSNIPIMELPQRLNELPKNKTILAICNRGNASYSAADYLKKLGFKKTVSLKGGMIEWVNAGNEVEQ